MERKVILAENAGFCFGANRGYKAVEDSINDDIPIYTFGPILNNTKIVEGFAQKGVKVVNNIEEFKNLKKGKIIIRSHGVSKEKYEAILATGFEVFDATCPFVKRIHKIVEKQSLLGDRIVVIGNPVHPEVEGIVGWSCNGATVIENASEASEFVAKENENITIVSQTTFNRKKFEELVDIFAKNSYNINVMNTICDATAIRQAEAEQLSQDCDVMIVIGDKLSSNSRKLYEICSSKCSRTYFVETVDDLKGILGNSVESIGITAGASTPKYIIEEVQNYVRNDF
ncbi:MAG: 4-hydroxy-3-methylbut-2-enyl diphosphate reductase [Lachnospiraceae bacterium]|nr:4-hydroxy-3-methylbut-2-enyl diphosphate reductase [Lachnospiraceae bacterium]